MQSTLTSLSLLGGQLLVNLTRVPEAHEWSQLRAELLTHLDSGRVSGVILDLAQAEILDELDLKEVLATRSTIQLMGLPMVLCGLQPAVVHAWTRSVDLPADLVGYASVQDALEALDTRPAWGR